ncbi:male-enhanced antigen 1 isoform X1 [Pogona vitticeps]
MRARAHTHTNTHTHTVRLSRMSPQPGTWRRRPLPQHTLFTHAAKLSLKSSHGHRCQRGPPARLARLPLKRKSSLVLPPQHHYLSRGKKATGPAGRPAAPPGSHAACCRPSFGSNGPLQPAPASPAPVSPSSPPTLSITGLGETRLRRKSATGEGVWERSQCMALEPVVALRMGPERICPNEQEELGLQEAPDGTPDPAGEWSSEEPEEEEEESNNGYLYQPLNQDPDQGPVILEETVPSTEPTLDINERLQAMRLHLPDPPVDSDEEEGSLAQSSHTSIPMDPEHVELVKRTMAGVKLPTLGIPAWANEISDDQWQDMVQRTLQARQSQSGSKPEWK